MTTPKLQEANYAIDTIKRLQPDHPELDALQAYVARKEELEKRRQYQEAEEEKQRKRKEAEEEKQRQQAEAYAKQHPILTCPYCHVQAPAAIGSKVSTGGWIAFVILLINIIGIPLRWIGLLFREEFNVCRACGIKLGTKLYLYQ